MVLEKEFQISFVDITDDLEFAIRIAFEETSVNQLAKVIVAKTRFAKGPEPFHTCLNSP